MKICLVSDSHDHRRLLASAVTDAKARGVLFSLHMKATMMKVSDPIIFGHAVEVFFADVFAEYGDVLRAAGANPNNGLGGVLAALDSLPEEQRAEIEARLALGADWRQAIGAIQRDGMRVGMIPIINAMAATGVVALPGMMTGQILGGNPPMEAVKYQILIMFLIAGGTGMGTMVAVWMGSRRLFDERQRLRLDRLR